MNPRPAQVISSARRDEGGHWLTIRFDGEEFVIAGPEAHQAGSIVHVLQDQTGRLVLARPDGG